MSSRKIPMRDNFIRRLTKKGSERLWPAFKSEQRIRAKDLSFEVSAIKKKISDVLRKIRKKTEIFNRISKMKRTRRINLVFTLNFARKNCQYIHPVFYLALPHP